MMFSSDLMERDLSAIYGLSLTESPDRFVLKIHKLLAEKLLEDLQAGDSKFLYKVNETSELFSNLGTFSFLSLFQTLLPKPFGESCQTFTSGFGFDGVFSFLREDGEFLEFVIPIEPIIQYGEECKECGGTGIEKGSDFRCSNCHGRKKEVIDGPLCPFSILHTLQIFYLCADFYGDGIKSSAKQLFALDCLVLKGGRGGYNLTAIASPSLAKFLSKNAELLNSELFKIMSRVYEVMKPTSYGKPTRSDFLLEASRERFNFQVNHCKGGGCWIGGSWYFDREEEGFSIHGHNIDHDSELFFFILVLAAIERIARNAGI